MLPSYLIALHSRERLCHTEQSATKWSLSNFCTGKAPVPPKTLGGSFSLFKSFHSFAFALIGFKNGEQLGDLQQIADALGEVG
jgi:hypothetical protein